MSVITKGLGSNVVTKGYGSFLDKVVRKVLRVVSRIDRQMIVRSRWKRN